MVPEAPCVHDCRPGWPILRNRSGSGAIHGVAPRPHSGADARRPSAGGSHAAAYGGTACSIQPQSHARDCRSWQSACGQRSSPRSSRSGSCSGGAARMPRTTRRQAQRGSHSPPRWQPIQVPGPRPHPARPAHRPTRARPATQGRVRTASPSGAVPAVRVPAVPVVPVADSAPSRITAINGSQLSLKTDDGWTRTIDACGRDRHRAGRHRDHRRPTSRSVTRSASARPATPTAPTPSPQIVRIPPQASGTVKTVDANSATLTQPDGTTKTIGLTSSTTYTLNGNAATAADLKVGTRVHATGTVDANGNFTATKVGIAPAEVHGTVTAKSGNTITLKDAGRRQRHGQRRRLHDLREPRQQRRRPCRHRRRRRPRGRGHAQR